MNCIVSDYPAFVDAARQAVRSRDEDVLDSLGWWDLLDAAPSDVEARAAVYSLFEADGWEGRSSGGLAVIAAAPYRHLAGEPGDARRRAVVDPTGTGGSGSLVLRGAGGAEVLRHVEGTGLVLHDDGDVVWGSGPGALDVGRLVAGAPSVPVHPEDAVVVEAGTASIAGTRLALAFSLVGACRTMQVRALAHAEEREQFGQPIGRFQAMRHLLATMAVETEAASNVCQVALGSWVGTPHGAELARLAKAVAGRAAARVAQHALQVFGAAGFTWEHAHTELQRRVLVLDTLYGSYPMLSAAIGRSTDRSSLLYFSQQVWTTRTADAASMH